MMIQSDNTTNPHRPLERTIYIYENERLWIGRGFSKKGLLPTERGPYSSPDGSICRKTIEDAGLALLGSDSRKDSNEKTGSGRRRGLVHNRGWSFHEEGDEEDRRRRDRRRRNRGAATGGGDGGDGDDGGATTTDDDDDDDDRGGFVACLGTAADGPTDGDGWQYFRDFSPQSLSSPHAKRCV